MLGKNLARTWTHYNAKIENGHNKEAALSHNDLTILRTQIRAVDEKIIEMIKERMNLSREIGRVKDANRIPIKDFAVEKQVIETARTKANEANLSEDLAEKIFKILIEHSVMLQEETSQTSILKPSLGMKKIVVIGGKGQMGQWFGHFLASLGHEVSVYDPSPCQVPFATVEYLPKAVADQDMIVLATPMTKTPQILMELAQLKPRGLIFDLCSLKSPIAVSVEHGIKKGLNMASIHPMFGPHVKTLAGRNIVLCCHPGFKRLGDIENLFAQCSANLIKIDFNDHDRLMSYVLGSVHFLNLCYARMVALGPFSLSDLMKIAGTTFRQQLAVTQDVASENSDLYFEIQTLNHETQGIIKNLEKSMAEFKHWIEGDERSLFTEAMKQSQKFFSG